MIRSDVNQRFLCHDTDASSIVEKIREAVFARIRPHIESIDPNWVKCWISFDDRKPTFNEKEYHGNVPQDYRLELSFKIVAGFNGPARGSVDIAEAVEKLVPEPLRALLRTADAYAHRHWPVRFHNERHEIKIIPGRTLVDFENCENGYVRSGDDAAFEVEILGSLGGVSPDAGRVYPYTLDKLKAEMELDGYHCQAVAVSYLPHGEIETPEQLLASYKKADELCHKEYEKRVADRAATEAAAYAALSPEERAAQDARNERLAAQAGIIHGLMDFLPQP